MNRVWVSDGAGPVTEPVSMPVSRRAAQHRPDDAKAVDA